MYTFRQMSITSNKRAKNVTENIIIRTHFISDESVTRASQRFLRQHTRIERSAVSLSAAHLTPSGRTILTKDFMHKNGVSNLT